MKSLPKMYVPDGCWQHEARSWNFLEPSSETGQLFGIHTKLPKHSVSKLQSPSLTVHFSSSEQQALL